MFLEHRKDLTPIPDKILAQFYWIFKLVLPTKNQQKPNNQIYITFITLPKC